MASGKPIQSTLELCNRAAQMLKDAGFVFHCASRKTEACYYRWPDRPHLIRISEHRSKIRSNQKPSWHGHDPVAAKITFGADQCLSMPGTLKISDYKVVSIVAMAIGQYFMNSSPAGVLGVAGNASAFQAEVVGSNPTGRSTIFPPASPPPAPQKQ